jgi:hypothetical protein
MVELTKEELDDLELQAMQEVEEEEKEELKAEALEKAKAKLKAKGKEASKEGKAGTRMVQINLGKHSDRIVIDGRTFMQGRAYPLTLEQEQTIRDMAFRTHLHQAELRGKNFLRDFYGARPTNQVI